MSLICNKCFPFCIFKKDRTSYIRSLSTKFSQMIDPPRHYHINSKASLNPLCTAQLPLFYLASALEGSVIDFNTPTKTIPLKLLYSLLESPYFTGGQQYPPQPLHSFMNIYLLSNYCKYAQFTQFFLTLRWFQLNFCKSYLQFSFSGRLFLLAWYMHYLYACRFLGRNIFIQLPLTIGKQTIMFRPDQKFWRSEEHTSEPQSH